MISEDPSQPLSPRRKKKSHMNHGWSYVTQGAAFVIHIVSLMVLNFFSRSISTNLSDRLLFHKLVPIRERALSLRGGANMHLFLVHTLDIDSVLL